MSKLVFGSLMIGTDASTLRNKEITGEIHVTLKIHPPVVFFTFSNANFTQHAKTTFFKAVLDSYWHGGFP
jgi:hypothetical protein